MTARPTPAAAPLPTAWEPSGSRMVTPSPRRPTPTCAFSGSTPARTGTAANLVATPLASGRVYLTWTDQSTGGVGYIIERAPDVNGSPGTFAQVGQTNNPTSTFLDNGTLGVANTKFYYRLKPIN